MKPDFIRELSGLRFDLSITHPHEMRMNAAKYYVRHMMQNQRSQRRIIRGYKKISAITGKSPVQIWRDVKAGVFPAPIALGPNSVGWFEDEIDVYLESRPRVDYAPTSETNPWLGHNGPPPGESIDDDHQASDQKKTGRGSRHDLSVETAPEAA